MSVCSSSGLLHTDTIQHTRVFQMYCIMHSHLYLKKKKTFSNCSTNLNFVILVTTDQELRHFSSLYVLIHQFSCMTQKTFFLTQIFPHAPCLVKTPWGRDCDRSDRARYVAHGSNHSQLGYYTLLVTC